MSAGAADLQGPAGAVASESTVGRARGGPRKEETERKSFENQALQAPWATKNAQGGGPGEGLLATPP